MGNFITKKFASAVSALALVFHAVTVQAETPTEEKNRLMLAAGEGAAYTLYYTIGHPGKEAAGSVPVVFQNVTANDYFAKLADHPEAHEKWVETGYEIDKLFRSKKMVTSSVFKKALGYIEDGLRNAGVPLDQIAVAMPLYRNGGQYDLDHASDGSNYVQLRTTTAVAER